MVWVIVALILGWVGSIVVVAVAVHRRFGTLQRRALQAERLAELGTLTGGLAHEIKNPLSTVQLNLQLLQEDIDPHNPDSARLLTRLTVVRKEAARLREIVDDFLKYAGRIELDPKPTELNALLEELVDFFSPQAQLQRVQLRLKRHDGPLVANIDPRLVKQAVLNLMINGLHAIGPAGGELILSLRRADAEAMIDVTDTGTGIAPDVVDKIFQAYYTTKKGGTGLGLAMTRRIAEEHNGRITVQSDVGKGSVFSIHLPLAR